MECNTTCIKEIAIRPGFYTKKPNAAKTNGLNLTEAIQNIMNACGLPCTPCPTHKYILKQGTFTKFKPGTPVVGMHLNEIVKTILTECGFVCDCCTQPCVDDYLIYQGHFTLYDKGKGAKGLHLNKVIRDVVRDCGGCCNTCPDDCSDVPLTVEILNREFTGILTAGVASTYDTRAFYSCSCTVDYVSTGSSNLTFAVVDGKLELTASNPGAWSISLNVVCTEDEVVKDTLVLTGTAI